MKYCITSKIAMSEQGRSACQIAFQLDCGKTQIQNILKIQDYIKKQRENGCSEDCKYSVGHHTQYADLKKVRDWFCHLRSQNIPETDKMI